MSSYHKRDGTRVHDWTERRPVAGLQRSIHVIERQFVPRVGVGRGQGKERRLPTYNAVICPISSRMLNYNFEYRSAIATCWDSVSAEPLAEACCPPPGALGEALYFDAGEQRLFGWLHRPVDAAPSLGLVLCNPFGYEAICAHRSVRALAEAAAARGMPALRFDYSGTGDSADLETHADQLDVWSRDIIAAAAELRRRTGVDRVCLLGIRLGALLATLAAQRCGSIDGLILIGPIIDGPKYLRELFATRLAGSLRADPAGSADEPPDSADGAPLNGQSGLAGPIEVAGFDVSATTAAALAQVDLMALKTAPAPAMLILDGNSFPTARRWTDVLTALGVQVKYLAVPGLVEMAMTAPQFAVVPKPIVAVVTEWLPQLRSLAPPSASAPPPSAGSGASPGNVLTLPGNSNARHALLTERPVFLASSAALFGIVTEPRQGETRRRAVILLNAAADYHIGAGRMYVSLARKWARRGYFVLRLDLAGIGDSATSPGQRDDEVFPPAALENVRAAIDFLQARYGVGDVTLMGLCSGAYHALRAAVAALPVNRVLLVNPLNFFWQKGMALRELQLAEIVRFPAVYRERLFSFMHWRKLLTGQGPVGIWRIIAIYIHRLRLGLESTFRELARAARIRLQRDLGRELESLAARGVSVAFVFARGEPGITLLRLLAGSAIEEIKDRCRVYVIDSADHIFGRRGPRSMLEKVLSDELFAPAGWEAGPRTLGEDDAKMPL
jgi:alpha-beta hydrolase superfamily lysophospholipase